ncbi:RidA family protein [Haladaptatus sp. F3-133]|jgi:enamine deaminase RidA (YjgF/YER057c/UK114 family)|uniref:RidA family protein n=1 Tax=Halorutilus salinus TaxID=2487751 RepID=A0A9Q4C648_9EURY|nr:RidA family protein [Halorutilus salinus]MCX2819099.1 RidA family protein [Halorutilus salinus]
MERTNPEDMYEPVDSAYSQVVSTRREKTVFVAGTVPKDLEGRIVGAGDIGTQIRQVMENVRRSLSSEGASLSDVARIRTFTTDMERYLSADGILLDSFGDGDKPVSTLVSVGRLADTFEGVDGETDATDDNEEPRYLVEVDATAVLG